MDLIFLFHLLGNMRVRLKPGSYVFKCESYPSYTVIIDYTNDK